MFSYFSEKIKALIRPLLAEISYYLYYQFILTSLEVMRDGRPLKKGITAVVAARNESYTLMLCLRSLVGVVDQIVCIDNGSEDDTLEQMYDFQQKYRGEIEVDVISMPGALLGECRDAGLKATQYQWHLRWDADMICKSSGSESMKRLREKVLANNRPRAIQLPRTHLIGDLFHTHKLDEVVDHGEPILIRMSNQVLYKEYGKFDAVKLPIYYPIKRERDKFYFHCAGLKSDVNLMHRFFYFMWRAEVNSTSHSEQSMKLGDFDAYRSSKELELFGTNDRKSLKYRYQKQCVYHFQRYDPIKYGDYPEILKEEIVKSETRFEVLYQDGKPYRRIDREDKEMQNYQPTAEDLAWDPELFLQKFLTIEQCHRLGISPRP